MQKLLTKSKEGYIIYHAFGDMAQLVERYVRNVQATSSNLVISTRLKIRARRSRLFFLKNLTGRGVRLCKRRGVAQLVARSVRDAEVVGSSPVASTKRRIRAHFAPFFHALVSIVCGSRIREISGPPARRKAVKPRSLCPFRAVFVGNSGAWAGYRPWQ